MVMSAYGKANHPVLAFQDPRLMVRISHCLESNQKQWARTRGSAGRPGWGPRGFPMRASLGQRGGERAPYKRKQEERVPAFNLYLSHRFHSFPAVALGSPPLTRPQRLCEAPLPLRTSPEDAELRRPRWSTSPGLASREQAQTTRACHLGRLQEQVD